MLKPGTALVFALERGCAHSPSDGSKWAKAVTAPAAADQHNSRKTRLHGMAKTTFQAGTPVDLRASPEKCGLCYFSSQTRRLSKLASPPSGPDTRNSMPGFLTRKSLSAARSAFLPST